MNRMKNTTDFEFLREFRCSCGRTHRTLVEDVIIENGAIGKLPELLARYRAGNVFLLADANTYQAAGEKVCEILTTADIPCTSYIYPTSPEPDEYAVGACMMHFSPGCDIIIAVGSGVINDISKIVSHISGKPYVIVATAPSMDGYASSTSSMTMDGLKISLPSTCPRAIVGDIDILKQAPTRMLQSGLGDMLAKYISICEWRISHIITGEYYCETIADMVRSALKKCTDHADGLLNREDEAVQAIFEGLIVGGVAMSYAGLSRPASGVEHYFSHIWDMRALEFGTKMDLHGIQCAVGTLIAARLYEQIQTVTPDREKALAYVKNFDLAHWNSRLREFLGKSAEAMITLEHKEHKYDPDLHAARLEIILDRWEEILAIIRQEVPSSQQIKQILCHIGAPTAAADIGIDPADLPMTFAATKDIRNKYVLSRLAWDLGILDELTVDIDILV